ncbi:MAG: hypothetical protein BWY95_00681 [Bacteroidetes bacterium ADurb.BinA104]|nr:MAG: hypothetical protein BWY95_00681 [Bacteroidetes bacterium ADurb.BinA104]
MVTVGFLLTITCTEAVEEQLPVVVPVTVYSCVELGETVMLAFVAPVLHKYVLPPAAVNVVELPSQISVVPEIVIFGKVETVTVTSIEAWQPNSSIPVTV